MYNRQHPSDGGRPIAAWIRAMALATPLCGAALVAASAQQVVLDARADARVQGGSPTVNFGTAAALWVGNPDKTVFFYFDLDSIPAGATINSAEFLVTFYADNGLGPNTIDLGGIQARWNESQITFANQPSIAWSGRQQTVSGNGLVTWDVTPAVRAWLTGQHTNYGLALRGDGPMKAARSRENPVSAERPRLRVSYTVPTGGGAPELSTDVTSTAVPVPYAGEAAYTIRLRHNGSQTAPAQVRNQLPYPQHLLQRVQPNGQLGYFTVATSGGATGNATIDYNRSGPLLEQVVRWDGTMPPGSEVRLAFDVHVHPLCGPSENTVPINNDVQARSGNSAQIMARDSYRAACAGYAGPSIDATPIANPIDPSQVTSISIRNRHNVPVILGLFPLGASAGAPVVDRVRLAAGEQSSIDLTNVLISSLTASGGKVGFCFLFDDDQKACPDRQKAPTLFGELVIAKAP